MKGDAKPTMDTRPDEDETLMAFDPLDVVEHVLTAENLTFDRTEDGDLAFALAGDWKDYELWFAWRPEADCLQLCLSVDLRAGKEVRGAAHSACAEDKDRGHGRSIHQSRGQG